jgi:nicotinamidase-related amidase
LTHITPFDYEGILIFNAIWSGRKLPARENAMIDLDARHTALVAIDPQAWTLGMPVSPHSADTVVSNLLALARAIRSAGGIIVLTRAAFSPDYADLLTAPVDMPLKLPEGGVPPQALAFHERMQRLEPEVIVTKRQWSAFHGTELDLQLRRRGMTTVVLGGVMTNFGVESTARDAWQQNYAVLVAEDACSSLTEEMHRFAAEKILPRVGRVRPSQAIIQAFHDKHGHSVASA